MKKLIEYFLSMSFMAFLVLFMAASTGLATFIENDYGAAAARAKVYGTWWFELLLFLILINLIGNIIQKKLFKTKKLSIFLYHFAFFFIFIGAAVTRYISYEGTMHIREGASSNHIFSAESFIFGTVHDGTDEIEFFDQINLTSVKKNKYSNTLTVNGKRTSVKLLEYIPNATQALVPDPMGKPVISFVVLAHQSRESYLMKEGDVIDNHGIQMGFNHEPQPEGFYISWDNNKLHFTSATDVLKMDMTASKSDTLAGGMIHPFEKRVLYTIGEIQLVLTEFQAKGRVDWLPGTGEQQTFADVLRFELSQNGTTRFFDIFGKADRESRLQKTTINGTTVSLAYGPRPIELPFELHLRDFILDRYPGSNSPSSFASEVILIDTENGIEKPYRIFMNNILKYRGFRFFQSSYDTDEKGTILSVNHDFMGTSISYLGYFLMTLGMVLSIFNRNSRFMALARSSGNSGGNGNASKAAVALIIGMVFSGSLWAQMPSDTSSRSYFPESQVPEFSSVLVQDQAGRIKPFSTMASDIVRKVVHKESYEGMNPVQVVMGMHFFPEIWQTKPMIKVGNDQLKNMLGVRGKYAAFTDFFDRTPQGGYKLASNVRQAYQKEPGQRSKFDQEIMKVDERVNVSYMVYSGAYLKFFPVKDDPSQKWYTSGEAAELLPSEDSVFVAEVMGAYYQAISRGNQLVTATEILNGIKKYQTMMAPELVPGSLKIKLEIFYQNADIFQKLSKAYGLIGIFMLLLLFVGILNRKMNLNNVLKVVTALLVLGFIAHSTGLAILWYVAGHAPLSNGYESMIFIAWASMLAGLIFVRKSPFAIVASSILASLTLMVAHMSWMNPEITNLVPVLKSYWLTIHVSVIITSYGFLGIGMVLGLINLFLYVMKTDKNRMRLQQQIESLTNINEMSLTLGLYFLSIGTFLGAVWANESWGRYWGWDPKETWALITILIYVFITHMRMVPGIRGPFALNLASVIGFSSVLMTYFGVNYYLSGLHSYAGGDSVPIPGFVYYSVVALALVFTAAWFNERKYIKKPVKAKI